MLDADTLSQKLEELSDADLARKRGKQLRPLRGLRGVPPGELARLLAEAWQQSPARLPEDGEDLHLLFTTAHEDGLLTIGLVAATVPDAPVDALEMVDRWALLIDDVETADALGWLVLGPALLASGEPFAEGLLAYRKHPRPLLRRMALMAGMAALPVPIEGPSASALRARMGEQRLAFVAEPVSDPLEQVALGFLRDPSPQVQKSLSRLLRSWAIIEPDRVERLIAGIQGGIPKVLRAEVEKGIKKGRRPARGRSLAE